MRDIDRLLETIATVPITWRQRWVAALCSAVLLAVTVLAWPNAGAGSIDLSGFIPVYQTAIVILYLLAAYLMLDQFIESRVVSLLWIGGGCFYAAMILVLQALSFPDMPGSGRLLGDGPATTVWLWVFWHLAPPVFAMGFGLSERLGRGRKADAWNVPLLVFATCALVLFLVSVTALIATEWVALLPTIVQGNDYWMLTTSGIGPATLALTAIGIAVLWQTTRFRTALQSWLALSLFCLLLDEAITQAGGFPGSLGWTVGRMEAMVSSALVLMVFLRQVRDVHRHVAAALNDLEAARAELRTAQVQLAEQEASLLRNGVALEASRRAAERASAAKSRFVTNMAHELRAPLTAIIGFCDRLALSDVPDKDRGAFFRLQRDAADRLLNQIGGVLDLAKIEAGRLEIEAVPLMPRDLLDSSVGMVGLAASSKGLALTADIHPALPSVLVGDPARLRQVLLNLLSNAITFTPAGGIHVTMEPVGGGRAGSVRLRCTVTDTGIGIAAERLPHLFQDVSQADALATQRFGGLGLAVSRQLIELMGGYCGVDSVPGRGSRFWFEVALPIGIMPLTTRALAGDPDRAPLQDRYDQGGRVLVVDDVHANRALLQQVLLRQGYDVTVADGGAAAVAAVRQGRFDVVLMDLQMPGMDGLAATAAIRASKTAGWNVPIVGITASNGPQEIGRCLAAGMHDCLTKPFDFGRLREVMRVVVPMGETINLAPERARLVPVR